MSRFSAVGPANSKRHTVNVSDPGKFLAAVFDENYKRTGTTLSGHHTEDIGRYSSSGRVEANERKDKKKGKKHVDIEGMEEVQLRENFSRLRDSRKRFSLDVRRRSITDPRRLSIRAAANSKMATNWYLIDEAIDVIAKSLVQWKSPRMVPEEATDAHPFELAGVTPFKIVSEHHSDLVERISEYSEGNVQILEEEVDSKWEGNKPEPGKRFILTLKDKTQWKRVYIPPVGFKVCLSEMHSDEAVAEAVTPKLTKSPSNRTLRGIIKRSFLKL